jgi:hypothetical protein
VITCLRGEVILAVVMAAPDDAAVGMARRPGPKRTSGPVEGRQASTSAVLSLSKGSARISTYQYLCNCAVLGIDMALVESDEIPDSLLEHSPQRPARCALSVKSKNSCHEVETTQ